MAIRLAGRRDGEVGKAKNGFNIKGNSSWGDGRGRVIEMDARIKRADKGK
jgi:hypothetical protein